MLSEDLKNMLSDFLVTCIGGKGLNGITYYMSFLEDTETVQKCMAIRKAATANGFNDSQLFRVYTLCNGYIFDLDLTVTVRLLELLLKSTEGGDIVTQDDLAFILKDSADSREREIQRMIKFCKKSFDARPQGSRETDVEVALFSRNTTPRIVISGRDKSNKKVSASYDAFRLRHWDIIDVNSVLLQSYGISVSRIHPCEILPTRSGVRFKLHIVAS